MSKKEQISRQDLLDFISGKMQGPAHDRLAAIIADDPFLSDAVEGLKMFKDPEALPGVLEELNLALQEKQKAKSKRVIAFPRWVSVTAAAAAILIVFLFGYDYVDQYRSNERIFSEKFEPYEAGEVRSEKVPPSLADVENDDEEFYEDDVEADRSKEEIVDNDQELGVYQESPMGIPEVSPDLSEEAEAPKENSEKVAVEDDELNVLQNTESGSSVYEFQEENNSQAAIQADKQVSTEAAAEPASKSKYEENVIGDDKQSESVVAIEKSSVRKSNKAANNFAASQQERSPVQLEVQTLSKKEVEITESLMEAKAFYEEERFEEALKSYKLVLQQAPANDEANFFAAVCLLREAGDSKKNVREASGFLDTVIDSDRSEYYEAALWYRALAKVKLNKKSAAIKDLEEIILLKGEYHDRALEMQQELQD